MRSKTRFKKKNETKPGLGQELSPLIKCLKAGGHAPDPQNPQKNARNNGLCSKFQDTGTQEIPQGKSPGQRDTFASITWQLSSEE